MAILFVIGESEYYIGDGIIRPARIIIQTNDTLATVMATGYLNSETTLTYTNDLMALVQTSEGLVELAVNVSGGNTSLIWPVQVPKPQSSASRSLNTAFQLSTARGVLVNYSVDIASTISLTTGQSGTVVLEIASNSGFSANVQTLSQFTNGNAGTLTIGLNLTQTNTGCLVGFVPAGYYCRLRTVNNTGTPTFTYRAGQETFI